MLDKGSASCVPGGACQPGNRADSDAAASACETRGAAGGYGFRVRFLKNIEVSLLFLIYNIIILKYYYSKVS